MFKAYFIPLIFFSSAFSSCTVEPGPEEVVKAWLMHKSKGECQHAFDLEVDSYHREFDEYECQSYPLEIKDINCDIEGESAICGCYETRGASDTREYFYVLKKVDGVWKVQPDS